MKNLYYPLIFILLFSLISCSSSQSFNHFYNTHKNDTNVRSFQIPGYLRTLIKNVSPELNDLFKNVNDFRSISFTNCPPEQSKKINDAVNSMTKNYTDVIRNNTEEKRFLVSVKEKGDKIKVIIIHSYTDHNHSVLFLKGNFDPDRIQTLINSHEFEHLVDQN